MQFEDILTDDAVLAELGRRLERHRLERNMTQAELAYEAQIGRATLQRLEHGRSVQSLSLVKVLRALGLIGSLDVAIPASVELPIAELERHRRRGRSRARHRREAPSQRWQWGEDEEARG